MSTDDTYEIANQIGFYKIEVDAMKAALDAAEVLEKALSAAGAWTTAASLTIATEAGPVGELWWDAEQENWRFVPEKRAS